jgi:beta-glucanase (GH16 family)
MNIASLECRKFAAIALAVSLFSCGGGSKSDTDFTVIEPTAPVSDWVMVWNDEFDGAKIDANKWNHEVNCNGGGNNEQQCYTDSADNSFVSDGTLKIVAKPAEEGAALPYTSARLNTRYKADFTYGRFEMRAKLPQGQGSWPAFWMLPTDYVYGQWPKSGEIDIMEAVNLKTIDGEGKVENNVHGTLHYGSSASERQSSGKNYSLPAMANPADDFHTYAIEWQEGEIRWYVDGYLYQTQMASQVRLNSKGQAVGLRHRGWFSEYFDIVTGALETHWDASPFDQDFHLLLNLAVGGDWPSNVNNTGIDASAFANGQTYEVDYVRVYECSVNPMDGTGCETVRKNYKVEASDEVPDGALVLGKAPIPAAPSTGVATPITIFADAFNPAWPAWDCCGGTTPEIVSDDAEHGAVVEFKILDNNGTVLGFNTFQADVQKAFDASPMLTTGSVKFDMKVVTAPSDANAVWKFKIESGGASQAVELDLSAGNGGNAPVVGQWQSYKFSLQSLADAGLDLSNIDVIMIFPAWTTGAGAVYRVDNVMISEDSAVVYPELVLFDDGINPSWPLWDCCGGTTPVEVFDDAEHGATAEFSIFGNGGTVLGFNSRDAGEPFDASLLQTEGVFQFDMKVVNAPSAATTWTLKIEAGGATSFVEVPLSSSNEGLDPVTGEWQTYTFSLLALSDAGLDLSAIDVVMIFPTWGTGDGAVYRVDNAKFFNPNANSGAPTGPSLVAFSNAINPSWPLWDCCGGTTPTIETDDAAHGAVAEFKIFGNGGTVLGFYSRDGGEPFDASELLTAGTLRFDMKVVTAPGAATTWTLKVEAGDATSFVELPLSASNEGLDPVTGEWQTYTFNLVDLADGGLDISAIDVIMIFPTWGTGDGAVFRVDNLIISNPPATGGNSGTDNAVLTMFADGQNPAWPLWDCCGGTTPTEPTDDAAHGTVAEFKIFGNSGTVLGFNSRDAGTPFNAEDYISTGSLSFEMKIVTAPGAATTWTLKVEAGDATSAVELPLSASNEGQEPVVGQWQTYTFDLLALADGGLDLTAIDVVMIFPTWGTGDGAVYRVDNVKINP